MNTVLSGRPAPAQPLPLLVANLGRRLPAYPGSLLCVAALNLVLRPHLPHDVRASLRGRPLAEASPSAQVVRFIPVTAPAAWS